MMQCLVVVVSMMMMTGTMMKDDTRYQTCVGCGLYFDRATRFEACQVSLFCSPLKAGASRPFFEFPKRTKCAIMAEIRGLIPVVAPVQTISPP